MSDQKNIPSRIKCKHDYEKNWEKAENFTPLAGELIVYDADINAEGDAKGTHTSPRVKIGDGVNKINDLKFVDSFLDRFRIIEDDIVVYDNAIEGYPLKVVSYIDPTQEGEGTPSPENIRPIVEHAEVELIRCGKNMFNFALLDGLTSAYSAESNSLTLTRRGVTIFKDGIALKLKDYAPQLKVGKTYCLSGNCTHTGNFIYLNLYGKSWMFGSSLTITQEMLDSNVLWYNSKTNDDTTVAVISNVQIELGKKATAFEPYNGDTFTTDFGQSVYAGTFNWTTGVLVDEYVILKFDGTEKFFKNTSGNSLFYNTGNPADDKQQACMCSHLPGTLRGAYNGTDKTVSVVNGNVYICDTRFESVDELTAYLQQQYDAGTPFTVAYKRAEPVVLQLTQQEVQAIAGTNYLFNNTGRVSVKQDYIRIDKTLTNSSFAADAKIVGDRIRELESKVGDVEVSDQITGVIDNLNLPSIESGQGENSTVIGEGNAIGQAAIAGGTTDTSVIEDITGVSVDTLASMESVVISELGDRGPRLASNLQNDPTPKATGVGSIAFGTGAESVTAMSTTIGAGTEAGSKGFYIHSLTIPSDGGNIIVQLSRVQKPYHKYNYTYSILGAQISGSYPVNENATWDNDIDGPLLASWGAGDEVNIILRKPFCLCEKIVNIHTDSETGKFTGRIELTNSGTITAKDWTDVTEFDLGEIEISFDLISTLRDLVTNAAKMNNLVPYQFSVAVPSKPDVGCAELHFAAIATGLGSIAAGTLSQAHGKMNLAAGQFSFVVGQDNEVGYGAFASGEENSALGYDSHAEGCKNVASGDYSHVEGYNTQAIGDISHAEGCSTVASGADSHAEGYSTKATGKYSHSEGYQSVASGDASHAEGSYADAANLNTHAEGYSTKASGMYSHAEGYKTTASGESAHAEGCSTTKAPQDIIANGKKAIINDWNSKEVANKYTLAYGKYSHAEGQLTLAMDRCAHAEGCLTAAIGLYTHTEGYETTASGENSHAEGDNTKASGASSHAEGSHTTASGDYSHAEGESADAVGMASHAEGSCTTAYGLCSHAEGYSSSIAPQVAIDKGKQGIIDHWKNTSGEIDKYTLAYGEYSHAEGVNTLALGSASHAEGSNATASGEYAHAEGYATEASGIRSHAEGHNTRALGSYSHAEGYQPSAYGQASHAEGTSLAKYDKSTHGSSNSTIVSNWKTASTKFAVAYGTASHIEGRGCIATGNFAHAEGYNTQASGEAAHAEGYGTEASGYYSHAEGRATKASAYLSHAEGYDTEATGEYSHAEGYGTIASGANQHVQGRYNIPNGNYAHIVGNGGGPSGSNAHTLDWLGNSWYAGAVTTNGADYAEFFEWLDGNPDAEDRVGFIVALDGEKIRLATKEDNDVLGVVSGTAAVLGDNSGDIWKHKYLTDEFGRIIYDMVEEFITKVDTETEEETEISVGVFPHPRINPEFNPELEYVSRKDRKEWDMIGMLGKLYVRDDGTCQVNGYACVGEDGIATASSEKTNMRVLSRVKDNIIFVLLK